jgi:hypothetical protein
MNSLSHLYITSRHSHLSLSLSLSPILPLPSLRKKREKLVFKSWYSVISKTNKSMTMTIIAKQQINDNNNNSKTTNQ